MQLNKWVGKSWTIWTAAIMFVTTVYQALGYPIPPQLTQIVDAVGTLFIVYRKIAGDNAAVTVAVVPTATKVEAIAVPGMQAVPPSKP